jgi:hypothetical protein
MVVDKVYHISSTIASFASKTFISRHLFNKDGKGPT